MVHVMIWTSKVCSNLDLFVFFEGDYSVSLKLYILSSSEVFLVNYLPTNNCVGIYCFGTWWFGFLQRFCGISNELKPQFSFEGSLSELNNNVLFLCPVRPVWPFLLRPRLQWAGKTNPKVEPNTKILLYPQLQMIKRRQIKPSFRVSNQPETCKSYVIFL